MIEQVEQDRAAAVTLAEALAGGIYIDEVRSRGDTWYRAVLGKDSGKLILVALSAAREAGAAAEREALADAVTRISEALTAKGFGQTYVNDETWNPQAHVEVTLTIADARAVHAAAIRARNTSPTDAHLLAALDAHAANPQTPDEERQAFVSALVGDCDGVFADGDAAQPSPEGQGGGG